MLIYSQRPTVDEQVHMLSPAFLPAVSPTQTSSSFDETILLIRFLSSKLKGPQWILR